MGVLTLQLWELVMRFPVLNPREVQETKTTPGWGS